MIPELLKSVRQCWQAESAGGIPPWQQQLCSTDAKLLGCFRVALAC